MGINNYLNRLNNTNTFFSELGNKKSNNSELEHLKAMSLVEINVVFSQINDKPTKQVFTNEISETIALNKRELVDDFPDRISFLEDFENTLKSNQLKGFYNSTKIDLTHIEQMLLIHYLQKNKKFPQVAEFSLNKGFYIVISALLNRNIKNSEQYLNEINIHKKNLNSLEKLLDIFRQANFKEAQEDVENEIFKLTKGQ